MLTVLLVRAPSLAGAQSAESLEYPVKAAILYSFTRFVTWPAEVCEGGTVTVAVLGRDPFGASLERAVEGKTGAGDRPLQVRRLAGVDEVEACSIVFIAPSETGKLSQILERLRGRPVLTVADSASFTRSGGMVGLFVEENRVRFDVNLDAARSAGLRISSRLLAVASTVNGRRP